MRRFAGLVDYVSDDDAVVAEAEKIARELAFSRPKPMAGSSPVPSQTPDRSLGKASGRRGATLAAISRTAGMRRRACGPSRRSANRNLRESSRGPDLRLSPLATE